MIVLIALGTALWIAAHWFKRLAPDARARMGDKAKGYVAGAIGLGVLLIIVGYRGADYVPVYTPPVWGIHANNLLVLIGFYLFAVSGARTRAHQFIRHPQLTGFSLWAAGHLLANGDLAALVLFGGLLVWSLVSMRLINRAEPDWTPPPVGPIRKEFTSIAATLVLFGGVAWVHTLLGYYPFG